MTKIKILIIFLLIIIPFIGFTQEFDKHNIDSLSKPLYGVYQIHEIHIYKKNQVRKYSSKINRKTKKEFQKKKVSWITEKQGKSIETYIIKVSDSTNYSYFIASMKPKAAFKEKIIIGNKYVMELNMIRYMGEVHGLAFKNLSINNGTCIPLPHEAQRLDIYTSPNLKGLYYVK